MTVVTVAAKINWQLTIAVLSLYGIPGGPGMALDMLRRAVSILESGWKGIKDNF